MKIIAVVPISTGKYKDDTTMLLEGLEKYHGCTTVRLRLEADGHVTFASDHTPEDMKDADIIWAPYEPLIEVAVAIREKLGIKVPIAGHYEQVPPGRVKLEEINDHHIKTLDPLPENEFTRYYHIYKYYASLWEKCDIKTTTDVTTLDRIERLTGFMCKPPFYVKPYPLDDELLSQYKKDVEEKYQIASCMRLVDHKRHHHVIKALSLLDNPPKYVIIGTGPEFVKLKQLAEELNVDVEFKGVVSDEEKALVIQESMFCVYPWAWLPVSEAAYFKKPSIAYYQPDTKNRLGTMPIYAPLNNIEVLAKMIEGLSRSPDTRKKMGEHAYEILMTGKCHTHPIKEAARRLFEILSPEAKE